MKTVKINKLRIKNFKGVKDLTLEPNGENLSIFGKNATGKTTIQDAFFYLLFGKDSNDRADFQLKPVDLAGQEIHHLDIEVEAVLNVDGNPVSLTKEYKEIWTNKRGTATQSFTGHTTDHYIDGVPVKKKDYDERICELININAFKLVTNPFEFANLHWTGRRNLLLEICGDVSDQEVINSNKDLSPLASILDGLSVDDHRAKVKATQKKINQKLKEIPARIAENQEMVKEAKAPDQNDKTLFDKKLSDLQDCLAQERNSEILSSKRVELNEVNAAILKERSRVDELNREGKKPILDAIDALEKEKRENANHVESLKDSLDRDKKRNATAKEAIEKVRDDYRIEFAKQPTGDTTCPTCGQELPFDQIEVTNETFNKVKAKRLEKINQEGKQLKAGIEAREKEISEIKAKIQDLNSTLQYLEIEIEKYRKKLSDIKSVEIDTSDLDQKKSIIESEIRALQNGSATRERDISGKITEISAKISGWEKQSAEYNAAEKARDRIKDLEKQEKDLSAEYEALEKELFLSEQFIVRKVEMLEESINSRFNLARFKLFETQVNGGLKECCEILYQGVPFDRGLNNAARVNVGIDIINTLSDYFQFQAPIFCDNAESVNVLADTSAQVLGLYVSEHEALTMEKLEVKQAS